MGRGDIFGMKPSSITLFISVINNIVLSVYEKNKIK